ncbi:MAG: 50S ribosomal protein L29 [Elusimicrobia bacterium]|nr:50S ribosomal protein L29 [Elusimicrobiota bacterium]
MKIKDKEAKKNLSAEELRAELLRLKEKRFKLRIKHKVTPLTNPLELRSLRRDIARLKTWIREKL